MTGAEDLPCAIAHERRHGPGSAYDARKARAETKETPPETIEQNGTAPNRVTRDRRLAGPYRAAYRRPHIGDKK
jgi:hypothetical protein